MSDASPNPPNAFVDAESLRRWPRKPAAELPLPPARFSLATLLAIITGVAIYLGLMRLIGILAVMALLGILILFHFIPVPPKWRPVKRLAIDLVAGIALPTGCLIFDPGLFQPHPIHGGGVSAPISLPLQLAIYSFFGAEMTVLLVWLFLGSAFGSFVRGMIAGVLAVGFLAAVVIGVPLALLGAMVIVNGHDPIGLLGAVPWIASAAHGRNAKSASMSNDAAKTLLGICAGAFLALAICPLVFFTATKLAPRAKSIPAANLGNLSPTN